MEQQVSVGLALAAGLLSFLSPCVLPLVPAYIGYLSGRGIEDEAVERSRTFLHALAFVFGFGSIFVLLGASVGLIGYVVQDWLPWLRRIGGVFLVVLGLGTLGVIRIPFLYMEKRIHVEARPEWGYFSSFLVGAAFGAGWTPCIGATLAAILFLAAQSQTVLQGAFLLSVYTLGLGVPFLLVALGLERARDVLRRLNRRMGLINTISGLFLILMGIVVYTNLIGKLNAYFFRIPLFRIFFTF